MKRLIGYVVVVMATLTALVVTWQLRSVIVLFLIYVVLAATVRPLVERLAGSGLSQPVAAVIVYLGWLALVVAVAVLAGRQLLGEFQSVANRMAASYEMVYPQWESGTPFQQAAAAQLPPPEDFYADLTSPEAGSLGQRVIGLSRGMLSLVAGLFVVLSLSLYWTIDHRRFERLWFSLLPVSHRAKARDTWRAAEVGVGTFLRSYLMQGLLALIALGLGYWALGLNFPLTLAVIGAVLAFIPLVGALFAALSVSLLVGMVIGPTTAVVAALFTIVILWILDFIVKPRFLKQRANNAILTVVLMLILVKESGLLGLVVAPALAVTIQSLAAYWFNQALFGRSEVAGEQLAQLRARLVAVEESRVEESDVDHPEIESLGRRLADLLDRADGIVPPAKAS